MKEERRMPTNNYVLTCKRVTYFSMFDEAAFFEWIKKIKSIKSIEGCGDELYLNLSSMEIPDKDLRELLGLFYRYKVDMKQLATFLNERNRAWFYENPKGYWHRRVFGLKAKKI